MREERDVLHAAGDECACDVIKANCTEHTEGTVPSDSNTRQVECLFRFAHGLLTQPHHDKIAADEGDGYFVVICHPHAPFNPVWVGASKRWG